MNDTRIERHCAYLIFASHLHENPATDILFIVISLCFNGHCGSIVGSTDIRAGAFKHSSRAVSYKVASSEDGMGRVHAELQSVSLRRLYE